MSSVHEVMALRPIICWRKRGLAAPASVQSCNFWVTQPANAAQSLRIDAVDTAEVTKSNYQFFRERLHDHAAWNSKRQQQYE